MFDLNEEAPPYLVLPPYYRNRHKPEREEKYEVEHISVLQSMKLEGNSCSGETVHRFLSQSGIQRSEISTEPSETTLFRIPRGFYSF